jgi:2-oxoglutarate/2-oxoacid ferredoxin oxidoreductase subunit alpha
MSFLWSIGGEAGFGIMTTGLSFAKIISRMGLQVFDYVEYPSLIRGGHNAYNVMFDTREVTGFKKGIDMLVCLNRATFTFHEHELTHGALVMYDLDEDAPAYLTGPLVGVPFRGIVKELNGSFVMKNTVALAASLALMGIDKQYLHTLLEDQFKRKGDEVVQFNKTLADHGYDFILKNHAQHIKKVAEPLANAPKQAVMTGNDAFSFGAAVADCRYYAAYPMTPSSTVLATLAGWQKTAGITVRHSEDEIAVINSALGASFAGVRSAVGTSGGGFALMVEAVSLAGVTETPIVIFLSQRPGPATGMPTWTEAGDLLFAVHSGHGEFPKIVLAPGDVEEMITLTMEAFNLADIYQTPVIVLSDMYLSESHKSISEAFINDAIAKYQVDTGKTLDEAKMPYHRYAITDDGISPRLIPGQEGIFYQANSYEHDVTGHTSETAKDRIEQVHKRARKQDTYLKNHFSIPALYGNQQNPSITFVGNGSVKGAILDAMRLLAEEGIATNYIHFTHVYPLHREVIEKMFEPERRYVLVENNSTGQFGKLLRQETGIDIKESYLRYDGRHIVGEDIVEFVNRSQSTQ